MLFQPSVLCSQLQNLIIHFLSLNELSDSLWLIWALSACLPPAFEPSLLRDSLWTALSKTPCSSPQRESPQERHICNCQTSFWYSGTSGWALWCKGCLSRTNVGHLVITIKTWGSLLPPSIRNTEKGLTPILLMEVGNSEFEKKNYHLISH